jgi:protein-S-isoprenylcysteine O-methyltransferase Ste14
VVRIFAAIRSIVYAGAFVLLWWWVVQNARSLDSRIALSIPEGASIPGLVVLILGAYIDLWCIGAFSLVGKGTPAPFDAPREFVASGPYRYVRNPMYLGALAMIIGAALILRSPSALLVALLFAALAHVFVLVYEEPTLEGRFGESYLRYKRTVNRWLPRLASFH